MVTVAYFQRYFLSKLNLHLSLVAIALNAEITKIQAIAATYYHIPDNEHSSLTLMEMNEEMELL